VRSPRRLTPAEVLDLRETGPFTRDPYTVKLLLDPATVKLTIKEIFNESMSFVKQAMRRSGIRDPRDLTVSKIARSQAGRPAMESTGRPTAYHLLPPRLNRDTKSHADGVDLNDWFKSLCPAGDPAAEQLASIFAQLPAQVQASLSDEVASKMGVVGIIARGDGQSTQTMTNEKGLHPEAFKRTILAGGGFHETGHFAFAGTPYLFSNRSAPRPISAHTGPSAAARHGLRVAMRV
jgi:hypothetical protein